MAAVPAALLTQHPTTADDPHVSDEELVERLRAGDEVAFRVLVARHRPWLVRLATRLLGNDPHGAEDLAQESLLKLHAAARQDRRPLRIRPWLAVVARNASLDEHRKRRPELPGELPEASTAGDGIFMLDPALSRAWSALSGRHREVMYLRELLGLSYREIATVMGLTDSAVETLLFRARAALRREYERAGGSRFGCGVLGLGLYRFASGERRGAAGNHVAGCDACGRAVAALRELASPPGAPVPASSASPGGRCTGVANLPSGADLAGVPPSLWTSLANGEPLLAKVFSAGAAIAAAIIPAALTGSLTTTPTRPATQSVASPAGVTWATPFPAGPGKAVAVGAGASSPAGAPVRHPPVSAPAGTPPGQMPEGRLGASVPSPDTVGDAAAGGDRLREPRVDAGDLGAAPRPWESLSERRNPRSGVRDELRFAGGLAAARALQPQPVSDRPRPKRLTALLSRLIPEAPVSEPTVIEPTVTAPAAEDGTGDGDATEDFEQWPSQLEPRPSTTASPEESAPTPAPPDEVVPAETDRMYRQREWPLVPVEELNR